MVDGRLKKGRGERLRSQSTIVNRKSAILGFHCCLSIEKGAVANGSGVNRKSAIENRQYQGQSQ
jgi:hypothetical protein